MNTQELEHEIAKLMLAKRKNEERIPVEELQTRYKNAYEKLCNDLKDAQCTLRAIYAEIARGIMDIMADSVYMDPEDKSAILDCKLNAEAVKFNHDPLADAFYVAFYHSYCLESRELK